MAKAADPDEEVARDQFAKEHSLDQGHDEAEAGEQEDGQDGEAVGEDEYGMGWLEVKFDDGRVDSFDPANLNLPVAGVLTAGMPAIARAASASR